MNHSKLVLLFIVIFFSTNSNAQDAWTMRDSVGGPGKSASTAFSIGLKGYIGFGVADNGFKRSIYEYDPLVDDWDKMESLGGITGGGLQRASPVSFVIGDKAYVGLGNGDNPYFKDFWEYNPTTNTWAQKADYGGAARRQAVAFAIDTLAYVGTGLGINSTYYDDFWKYNAATNAWTPVAAFAGGTRRLAIGFSMKDKGYVGTGESGGFYNDFWEYDPVLDSWTAKAAFPGTPREAASAIAAFPDAIVGLGYDNTLNFTADLWSYNANTDSWLQLADFPGGARSHAVGFVIQQHAYLGCGYSSTGAFLDDFYEYETLISVNKVNDKKSITSKVYPNPSSGFCTIQIEGTGGNDLTVEIHNALGQQVTNSFSIEQSNYQNPKFHLANSHSPNGLYFYSIKENGNKVQSGQLMISK